MSWHSIFIKGVKENYFQSVSSKESCISHIGKKSVQALYFKILRKPGGNQSSSCELKYYGMLGMLHLVYWWLNFCLQTSNENPATHSFLQLPGT